MNKYLSKLQEQLAEVNRLEKSVGKDATIYVASTNYYLGMKEVAIAGSLVTASEVEEMELNQN